MKKVSIIIPCYNCEKTLEITVDSIMKQTYQNIEIVLVDDGSSDDTPNIIHKLSKMNNIVTKIQKNNGVSVARNVGLELITGEYAIFVDSDDWVNEHFIEFLVSAIEVNNCDTAYCFSSRKKNDVEVSTSVKLGAMNLVKTQTEFMQTLMYEKYHLVFCGFIYRTSIIKKFNIKFPVGVKTGEDLEFLWTYLVHCNNAVEIQKYLYWYYDNASSAVHRVDWDRTNSYKSIERISNEMRRNNCEFVNKFESYTSARYLWSYAKTFSVGKRPDLFDKLGKEYDVKRGMKYLLYNCPDYRVRITSLLYCINAKLFYFSLRKLIG